MHGCSHGVVGVLFSCVFVVVVFSSGLFVRVVVFVSTRGSLSGRAFDCSSKGHWFEPGLALDFASNAAYSPDDNNIMSPTIYPLRCFILFTVHYSIQ
jgi:hypothetical protein